MRESRQQAAARRPESATGSPQLREAEFTTPVERISVIAPMLNEGAHVEQFAVDLAAQDFAGELEILVADGGSADGSPELLEQAAHRAGLNLTVLENPARWASAGLNVCLRRASGDLIVRLDCHTRYPPDYLRRCAVAAEETGAWSVGGVFEAVGRTPMERAVACAYASPFGGVAWSRHLGDAKRVEVDLVYYGAFRPQVFERVGLYDEAIAVTELEDFSLRVRQAGGRVVFDPSIRLFYTPRGSFRRLFVQYYRYGLWKVAVMRKHAQPLSGRSLVPFAFVASLACLGVAAAWSGAARWLLGAELALYAGCALAFGVEVIARRRESWRLLPRVLAVFPTLHLAHGLGQIHGWLRVARGLRSPRVARARNRPIEG